MIGVGQIVEYIADNRFMVGVCLEMKNDKPRLLVETNREVTLPARRLIQPPGQTINPTAPRQELIDSLTGVAARREEIKTGLDLGELWELVEEEESGRTLDPAFLAGLIFGEPVEPDQVSALIRAVVEDKLLFRYSPEGLTVTPADKVEQLAEQRARAEAAAREKEQTGHWLARVWSGESVQPPQGAAEITEALKDVAVFGRESDHFTRIKAFVDQAGIKDPQAAFKLLVKLGVFNPDENLELHRLALPLNFPDRVLSEAEKLAARGYRPGQAGKREDTSGLTVLTIDGPETKDFDDALSITPQATGFTVHIHIADPTPFIQPGSALDEEARGRASSIYLPDLRLPMLPPALSEGLLSLLEGQPRPALSLAVDFDDKMNCTGHRFFKSELKVDRRLTYDQADEMIASGEENLDLLSRLAKALKEERRRSGAMILEAPEVDILVDEDGRVDIRFFAEQGPARVLVAELMVLANRLAAEELAQAGIPTLFRAQEPPKGKFEAPEGSDPLWVIMRRRMLFNRLELTSCPTRHAGMGLAAYTTFTSPIRRYLDLVTIRQMAVLLEGGVPVFNEPELEELCQLTAPLLRTHNQLRFARHRYWLLKYMAQFPDREWEALVLDRMGGGFSLVLTETMLRAKTPRLDHDALTPGERIKVRAAKIRPQDEVLKLELI